MTSALISAQELLKILKQPHVKVLDASYKLQPLGQVIGHALEFDIDDVADPEGRLAHTLPTPEIFAAKISALGISNDDTVVVYDRAGMHMAASRVWWMFRIFGHKNIKILNGGLPAWVSAGLPLNAIPATTPAPSSYKATFNPALFKQKEDMLSNIDAQTFTVLDARDAKRFSGEDGSGGHIPNALSTPFANLIDTSTGLLKDTTTLQKIITDAGVDASKKIAISCGSGVTAGVVALALHELGKTDAAIYGGSWAEWGADPSLPKKTGDKP